MTTTPIRLLVVDDHNLFRQGLIRILGDYAQLQIVGQAANGQDALALVEQLQPDVVLMDVNMPVLSGPDAVRQMQTRFPGLPVVMLTVSERDEDLFDAIRAGVGKVHMVDGRMPHSLLLEMFTKTGVGTEIIGS